MPRQLPLPVSPIHLDSFPSYSSKGTTPSSTHFLNPLVAYSRRITSFQSDLLVILQELANLKVVLEKGKTQLFRNGSTMVYSGAVDIMVGRPLPKTGDMVLVTDGSEKPIG